jgi:hypothetical protein
MPSKIWIPCKRCDTKGILKLEDGRGKSCPDCDMDGWKLVPTNDVADCMLNRTIKERRSKNEAGNY